MKRQSTFTTLLIDLDDTIYPSTCGVWDHIAERIDAYMSERLEIAPQQVPEVRESLFRQYGTTLRGLQMTYEVDTLDFLAFVHDIPLQDLLSPDPVLRDVLMQYPQRKFIFTNADQHHARRVLDRLQLTDLFDGIVDILDIAPYCKPMPEAFEIALRLTGVSDPRQCVFIDDSPRNLAGASRLGIRTVQIGSVVSNDHHVIERLVLLPTILSP